MERPALVQPASSERLPADGDGQALIGRRRALPALRDRREELGLRLVDVEEATGVPLPTVQRIETGKQLASESQARALAGALGADVDEAFGRRMLLSSEAARVKRLGDVHTVTRAIARGDLAVAEENDHYVYLWADEVEAWQPRPQGGQRQLADRPCEWCGKTFRPRHAGRRFCCSKCRTAWREARRREHDEAEKHRHAALGLDEVSTRLDLSLRGTRNLVERGRIHVVRATGGNGRPRLLVPEAEIAAYQRDRGRYEAAAAEARARALRSAQAAAHAHAEVELARFLDQHEAVTLTRAAETVKLAPATLWYYHRQGRLPVRLFRSGAYATGVVRQADLTALAEQLRASRRAGIGPPDSLRAVYGEVAQRRWDGKLAVVTAAERGKKVGKPISIGDDEGREVVDRYRLGESQATIAEAMSMTRKQVRGALRRHGLAA